MYLKKIHLVQIELFLDSAILKHLETLKFSNLDVELLIKIVESKYDSNVKVYKV